MADLSKRKAKEEQVRRNNALAKFGELCQGYDSRSERYAWELLCYCAADCKDKNWQEFVEAVFDGNFGFADFAMGRLADRQWLNWGTSWRYAWLEGEGEYVYETVKAFGIERLLKGGDYGYDSDSEWTEPGYKTGGDE